MARKRMVFTSIRAELELGYRFRPVEEALAEAIAWFRESGYLRSLVRAALTGLGLWALCAPADQAPLPAVECTVETTVGSFFGYQPPTAGDRRHLDLNRLGHIARRIAFSSGA